MSENPSSAAPATPSASITTPSMRRVAVLDLGSNSFHVLVADADGDGTVIPILRQREMLHLGEIAARNDGAIPPDAAAAAADTVRYLADLARGAGTDDIHAVATAALRDASNGTEVVAQLSAAGDVDIEVIDGLDEAARAYVGVRASVALPNQPVLVLDLGGGSLEFAVGTGTSVDWAASTRLGVGRVHADCVKNDPLSAKDIARIRQRVHDELDGIADQLDRIDRARTIIVGGTLRALARLAAADGAGWYPRSLNQLALSGSELSAWADALSQLDLDARAKLRGMKKRRADHVHIAAIIIASVIERLGDHEVVLSNWGLREGTILRDLHVGSLPDGDGIRAGAIDRLRRTFSGDDAHPDHVAHLAGRLFDELADVHRLGTGERDLLIHASHLHAIGEAIALRRQHKHGAYLISNAELRGFAPKEIAAIVTLVRHHESRSLNPDFAAYTWLDEHDQDRVRRLLPLLQLANALDRTRDQSVEDVRASMGLDHAELRLVGSDAMRVARTELDRRAGQFLTVYGVPVDIVG